MKRIIALLLILGMLSGLSACKAKSEAATAPEPAAEPEAAADPEAAAEPEAATESEAAAESEPAAAEEEAPPLPDDIAGSWILVDSNDTELTEELFPGAKELGGTMEIGEDGLLFWTVGRSSGSGRILTAEGDDVSVELSRGPKGEMVPMAGLLERSNEALALYLNFGGVDLIWVHVLPQAQS